MLAMALMLFSSVAVRNERIQSRADYQLSPAIFSLVEGERGVDFSLGTRTAPKPRL